MTLRAMPTTDFQSWGLVIRHLCAPNLSLLQYLLHLEHKENKVVIFDLPLKDEARVRKYLGIYVGVL